MYQHHDGHVPSAAVVARPRWWVDVTAALDALDNCVGARPVGADAGRPMRGTLLDAALGRLGLCRDDLATAPIVAEGAPHGTAPGPRLTIGARVALRTADRADRRGLPWDRAVDAARRDVVRLLDVVPVSLLRSSLDTAASTRW